MKISEFIPKEDNVKTETKDNKLNIDELYNKYKDKSQGEIMGELFSEVQKQKSNGTFDYEKILGIVNTISPYLTAEQKTNLITLLDKLK